MPKISIIIRTKNEERWIGHCLSMIFKQDYKNFEVILVDNESIDHTLEIANRFPILKKVTIKDFKPGFALNEGIRLSSGEFIVCLSAHCIPKNTNWLSSLIKNFNNEPSLAGVYGRQLPVSFTSPIDKRDLLIAFGQDRRKQIKDYFFHNANSMIRKEVWQSFPFDELVSNIEDRVWGKEVINAGYHIIYDPEAEVYHHHGLHQGNKVERVKGVVSIIDKVEDNVLKEIPNSFKPENINISAIIPVTGDMNNNANENKLLDKCIESLINSKYIKQIYVVSEIKPEKENKNLFWIDRSMFPQLKVKSLDILLGEILKILESKDNFPRLFNVCQL